VIEAGDAVVGIRVEDAGLREEVVGLGEQGGRLAVAIPVVGAACRPPQPVNRRNGDLSRTVADDLEGSVG